MTTWRGYIAGVWKLSIPFLRPGRRHPPYKSSLACRVSYLRSSARRRCVCGTSSASAMKFCANWSASWTASTPISPSSQADKQPSSSLLPLCEESRRGAHVPFMLYITKYVAQGFCHKSSLAIDHSQAGEILPQTLRNINRAPRNYPTQAKDGLEWGAGGVHFYFGCREGSASGSSDFCNSVLTSTF